MNYLRLPALSLIVALPLSALATPTQVPRQFADRMMVCNAHALLLRMYAHDTVLNHVPDRAPYRDLAYAAAGQDYVAKRLDRTHQRDLALAELEPLLSTRPFERLSEQEKSAHIYAMWPS